MSQSNPFATPPGSPQQYGYSAPSSPGAAAQIGRELAGTKGWVFFLSILANIAGGLLCVFAFFALVGGGMAGLGGRNGVAPGMLLLLFFVLYAGIGALYLTAGYWLRIYAKRTTDFLRQPTTFMLEETLSAQKSFWKLFGICTIVILALYLLGILFFFSMLARF